MVLDTGNNPNNPSYSTDREKGTPIFPGQAVAVTKSDTTTYAPAIAVYVGVTGNVAIVPALSTTGTAVTFVGVPAGSMLPCMASKVMSTNTTASSIVGIS